MQALSSWKNSNSNSGDCPEDLPTTTPLTRLTPSKRVNQFAREYAEKMSAPPLAAYIGHHIYPPAERYAVSAVHLQSPSPIVSPRHKTTFLTCISPCSFGFLAVLYRGRRFFVHRLKTTCEYVYPIKSHSGTTGVPLRVAVGSAPLYHLPMPPACSSCQGHVDVPGAPINPAPLQDLQVPSSRSCTARVFIPGTTISLGPL